MNRTDRLYALREALRRAGAQGRTADDLAARFEVSTRTIKRDISALQHAGFPVWSQPGPGGGYTVDGSATLPPVSLTPPEVSGLAAALAGRRGHPFEGDAHAALDKLLNVLDPTSRRRASALASRIWVDAPALEADAGVRRAVEQAIASGSAMSVRGEDDRGHLVESTVDPVILAFTRGAWFLVAWRRDRDRATWLRLDRIERASVLAERARDIPASAIGAPPATAAPIDLG
ncbi:YafY family protein [Agromyces sp. LHK192]|uniref:helix-turn-helix transcriptional regulator n=1 Tax=Agromyces sp. LHK192 TaxID=2498704 RepID=UPI000FD6D1D5|nr:WYL domain-containing protein [Agromyces sp. LHK192]